MELGIYAVICYFRHSHVIQPLPAEVSCTLSTVRHVDPAAELVAADDAGGDAAAVKMRSAGDPSAGPESPTRRSARRRAAVAASAAAADAAAARPAPKAELAPEPDAAALLAGDAPGEALAASQAVTALKVTAPATGPPGRPQGRPRGRPRKVLGPAAEQGRKAQEEAAPPAKRRSGRSGRSGKRKRKSDIASGIGGGRVAVKAEDVPAAKEAPGVDAAGFAPAAVITAAAAVEISGLTAVAASSSLGADQQVRMAHPSNGIALSPDRCHSLLSYIKARSH